MAYLVSCNCTNPGKEKQPKGCIPCGKHGGKWSKGETDVERYDRFWPLVDMLETNRKVALRQEVENRAELRKITDQAKFKTDVDLEGRRIDVEIRAEKLKRIMEDEMFGYAEKMRSDFEKKKDSKIDAMRQRVKELKDKRLAEERKLVEKKLDQAFQSQCEQMREMLSKKLTQEIVNDWGEQIQMKKRLEAEDAENDRMYACLVNLDVENKWKREQAQEAMRVHALKKGLEELDRQIQYKKEKTEEAARVQAEELALNEQIRKEVEEEQRKREEERKAQSIRNREHVKDMLETREHYKTRRMKREEIVAQEFLKKAVRELYIEEEDRNKAKRELMRSIQIYIEYLQKRDCFNNQRGLELQKIVDAVIEEQYAKTVEVRRREQRQRRQLFCNVMAGRAQQIEDLKAAREREEMERQKELEYLKEDWKQYLRELEYEKELQVKKREQYRQDLDCQLEYQAKVQDRDAAEVKRERKVCDLEEGFFLNRLNTTVRHAHQDRSNPFREPLVGKEIKQCLRPV